MRTHPETLGCFFDRKVYKPDIQASLKSGGICDQHRKELLSVLSPHTKAALELLCRRVANDLPYGLVLKGGGVKGLALVGALEVLCEHVTFDTYAGTSAGAIAAVLLASGYSPEELKTELSMLDFKSFCREKLIGKALNWLRYQAPYSGEHIDDWVEKRLAAKKNVDGEVLLQDLKPKRAIVFSCTRSGLVEFDSHGPRSDTPAGHAVRCSAAIPYYFGGATIDGKKAFDGGLNQNFPFTKFINDNPAKPVIGLCLKAPVRKTHWTLPQLIDGMTTGDEPTVVRQHADKIVLIDPDPIRTTDFDVSAKDKQFLLAAGRAAALRYLASYLQDSAPDKSVLLQAEQTEQTLRQQAKARWNRA